MIEDAISSKAFPGASVAVVHHGKLVAQRAFGRHMFESGSPLVSPSTIFDIASVSKVMATTMVAAILYDRGMLDLATTVPGRDDLTIRRLLTHASGLPAYVKFYDQTRDPREIIELAYATPLEALPGSRTEYSDIGFIILGNALEHLTGEPLDQFCRRNVFAPLGLANTVFCPPADMRDLIAPTEDDQTFRHKVIQGEVHDQNAWVMGGVAGHAGLFSTAYDVATFAQCWLTGGPQLLNAATVSEFTRQQPNSTRALGWDRPTPPSSSGRYFSGSSFGHLGFTGTSLWCDPEKELAVVLLTNRTWPDARNQAIKQIRPLFHDAIVEAL